MKLETMMRMLGLVMVAGMVVGCAVDEGSDDETDGEDEGEVVESTSEGLTKSCAKAPASSHYPFAPDRAITIVKVSNMTCKAAANVWRNGTGSLASRGWKCTQISGSNWANTNRCANGDRKFWYSFAE